MTTHQYTGPAGKDWRHDAACRATDPERFFPTASNGPCRHEQEQDAKSVCRTCPVVEQCLDWALQSGQDFGIWGGTSEAERRTIKGRRRGAPRTSAPEPDHELAALARSATTAEKRRHALHAVDQRRQPRTAVAAAFAVSTRTVDRWLAQERARAAVAGEPAVRIAS